MSELKLVPATSEDIPQLVTLIQNSYRGEKGVFRDTHLLGGKRVTDQMIKEDLLSNPNGLLQKYVEDGSSKIIACVYTQLIPEKNMLFTGTLCVHPDNQTGGIGKKLMKAVEERARLLKCCAITLQVVYARTELIQWYERQGFRLTGESEPFPENRYGEFKVSPEMLAMVSMQKDL